MALSWTNTVKIEGQSVTNTASGCALVKGMTICGQPLPDGAMRENIYYKRDGQAVNKSVLDGVIIARTIATKDEKPKLLLNIPVPDGFVLPFRGKFGAFSIGGDSSDKAGLRPSYSALVIPLNPQELQIAIESADALVTMLHDIQKQLEAGKLDIAIAAIAPHNGLTPPVVNVNKQTIGSDTIAKAMEQAVTGERKRKAKA